MCAMMKKTSKKRGRPTTKGKGKTIYVPAALVATIQKIIEEHRKKIQDTIGAIQDLQDHGADCNCSICHVNAKIIADNPEIAQGLTRIAK